MLRKIFKTLSQKGQAIVFYALMVPTLFCFVGAAADFGWLYFNQSRLQNAADAAVTAGAKELIRKDQTLSDYRYTTFVANSEEGLQTMIETRTVSTRDTSQGDEVAREYVIKNLSKNDDLTDSWNDNADVEFDTILYGTDEEDYQALYYIVVLEEKFNHLFGVLENFGLGDLNAKAFAVAKITHVMVRQPETDDGDGDDDSGVTYPHGPSLYDQMKAIEEKSTYATWDAIQKYYEDSSNLASFPIKADSARFAADARSVVTAGQYYESKTFFRTEVATLKGIGFSNPGSSYHNKGYLKEESGLNQFLLDDLFVDFRADVTNYDVKNSQEDWDIDSGKITNGRYYWDYGDSSSSDYDKYTFRIHYMINIDKVYPVRDGKDSPDPLYIRIESEPLTNKNNISTVRQIIINVNVDNTNEKTDRPMIFFYEGPEEYTYRHSQPIILNLYHDFRGIIFAPKSAVAINGNGHNFEGFVVAEEYVQLKSEDDFTPVTFNNETHYVNFNDLTNSKVSGDYFQVKYNGNDCYVPKKKLYSLVTQEKNVIKMPTASSKTYDLNPMIIDGCGNVQYTDEISASEDLKEGATPNDPDSLQGDDKTFSGDPFNLASSTYNSFLQVGLVNYTYLDGGAYDNLFTTPRSKHVD